MRPFASRLGPIVADWSPLQNTMASEKASEPEFQGGEPGPPRGQRLKSWLANLLTLAIYAAITTFFFFRLEMLCDLEHELWRVRGTNDFGGRCGGAVVVHTLRHSFSGADLAHYVEFMTEEVCGTGIEGASVRKRDPEPGFSFHETEKTAALAQIEVAAVRWRRSWGDVDESLEEFLDDHSVSHWSNQTLVAWLENRRR